MALSIAQLVAVLLTFLVVGVYWGPWIALSRTMNALPVEAFLAVVGQMNRNLGTLMTVLTPLVLVAQLVLTVLSLGEPLDFWLSLGALLLFIATVVVTVAIEVPIVKQIVTWSPRAMPANWQVLRDRWMSFHLARVIPGVASLGLLVAAAAF